MESTPHSVGDIRESRDSMNNVEVGKINPLVGTEFAFPSNVLSRQRRRYYAPEFHNNYKGKLQGPAMPTSAAVIPTAKRITPAAMKNDPDDEDENEEEDDDGTMEA